MKNITHIQKLLFIGIIFFTFSCKKDDFNEVDISDLNPDEAASNTALDTWLTSTFLDTYNINVIYHYHRYYHEADRNVTPPNPINVQPMMTTVLEGFIDPYQKIAGETFIKATVPKEFVLYGSTSYDAQNVGYAGTAAGGIRVNLFGIDNFSLTPSFVVGKLGVIHHEFTHTLNQIYPMPADFETFTKAYYNANWTSTPLDTAHKYGFVTSYASQVAGEDIAETNRALLVQGQSWFDYWVKTTTTVAGQTALRNKESSIVNYYTGLNIDYRALQKEVQLYIKNTLKDSTVTFPYWLNRNLYKTMTVNLEDNMYTTFGNSSTFSDAYNQFKAAVLAYSNTQKYHLDYIQFMFTSNRKVTIRMAFTNTGGTQYFGDFDFALGINSPLGEVTFTKIDNATGTTYNNGSLFVNSFTNTIQAYLVNKTFIGDWLQANMPANLYTKTAGFYEKANTANYIYGPITL